MLDAGESETAFGTSMVHLECLRDATIAECVTATSDMRFVDHVETNGA